MLIDYQTLVDGLHDASTCETSEGQALPAATVRRLCCEANIVPIVLGGDGRGARRRSSTAVGQSGSTPGVAGDVPHAVPIRAAPCRSTRAGSTTSSTGSAADRPTWTTCCRCASATITSFTKAAGRCNCSRIGGRRGEPPTAPCGSTASRPIERRHRRSSPTRRSNGCRADGSAPSRGERPQTSPPSSSTPSPRCRVGRRPSDSVRLTGVRGSIE